MAASESVLATRDLSRLVTMMLYGEPSGSKSEEAKRISSITSISKNVLNSFPLHERLRDLPGSYPSWTVVHCMRSPSAQRDPSLQEAYSHMLQEMGKASTLSSFLEDVEEKEWKVNNVVALDVSEVSEAKTSFETLFSLCRNIETLVIDGDFSIEVFLESYPARLREMTVCDSAHGIHLFEEALRQGYSGGIRFKNVDFTTLTEEQCLLLCFLVEGAHTVDFSRCSFTDEAFKSILSSLGSCSELILDGVTNSSSFLGYIPSKNLRTLSWKQCPDTPEKSLCFVNLRTLDLSKSRVENLEFLADSKDSLCRIKLNDCMSLTEGRVAYLRNGFEHVEFLELQGIRLGALLFENIQMRMPRLAYLNVSSCPLPHFLFSRGRYALPASVLTVIGEFLPWSKEDGSHVVPVPPLSMASE